MNFIILYDPKTGYTEKIIPEPDDEKAGKMFVEMETDPAKDPDISVNFVSAEVTKRI